MKKILSLFLCCLMVLTLTGCGGSSGDDITTYTYSSELDIKNLDSSDADDGCSLKAIHAVIDGLTKTDKKGNIVNAVAKSEELSEDGLTHTYKLRKDVKWTNGDPVTAHDFVYAWQRIFRKKGSYYYMFADGIASIEGAQELSDKIDAGEELTDDDLNSMGVKAIDDYTLEVKTTVRVSFFDELMAFPCFFPINEKFCEKQGDKYGKSAKAILGNGAQYCNKEGKVLMDCYLNKKKLKEILPIFIEHHTSYMIFTTNGFYSTLEPDYVRDRFAYRGSVRFGNKMEDFLPGGPLSDSPACLIQQFDSIDEFIKKDLDIIKVEAFSHDEFEIQKVLPYFKDMKKIAYLSSYPDNVEITNENAQKGLILEQVIEQLNIKKEEVIVLGDGMNDITLFERFPYSFAPSNAEKIIQEKAYKVVSSCKDGAVSEAIEYALENL